MRKPRYQAVISLSEIDEKLRLDLIDKGWKTINIWRLGAETAIKIENDKAGQGGS